MVEPNPYPRACVRFILSEITNVQQLNINTDVPDPAIVPVDDPAIPGPSYVPNNNNVVDEASDSGDVDAPDVKSSSSAGRGSSVSLDSSPGAPSPPKNEPKGKNKKCISLYRKVFMKKFQQMKKN